MNIVEIARLLTAVSGFDRFVVVDQITTDAWHSVLHPYEFTPALAAVVEHDRGPDGGKPLRPGQVEQAIKREMRLLPHQIEEDVRSAKARGLVPADWSDRDALPEIARRKLDAARAASRELFAIHTEAHAQLPAAPIDHGFKTKDVA
jgi:hypothetical protein